MQIIRKTIAASQTTFQTLSPLKHSQLIFHPTDSIYGKQNVKLQLSLSQYLSHCEWLSVILSLAFVKPTFTPINYLNFLLRLLCYAKRHIKIVVWEMPCKIFELPVASTPVKFFPARKLFSGKTKYLHIAKSKRHKSHYC